MYQQRHKKVLINQKVNYDTTGNEICTHSALYDLNKNGWSLTLQRGVPSLDRHKINITCRGVPSTARILRAHTSTAISRTFMKQMQSGFFCLVENEAGFLTTYNTVLKIDYLLLFLALKYRSVYLRSLNAGFDSCLSLSNKCEVK
jgi:hypothetical protein